MFSDFTRLKAHHQTIFGIIIAVAIISLHRGVVGLMDTFLFPDDLVISHILSIAIAILILISMHYCVKML